MEGKQVPWWRKALNLALNGIRSGFGLFSRPQKNDDEIEPETAAGHEEIREEAELTKHSPELNSIEIEAASPIRADSDSESVNTHELKVDVEPAVETRPEQSLLPEPDVEAPLTEVASQPNVDPLHDADAEVLASPEEESLDPEPTAAEATPDLSLESFVEVKPGPVTESVAEVVQLEEEPASEPMRESGVTVSEMAIEAEHAADLKAAGVAAPANMSPEHENEIPAVHEDVHEPAETPQPKVEAPAAVAEAEPDTVLQDAEAPNAGVLEVDVQEPPAEQVFEHRFEQVTEQPVTVENVLVDEVAPQAESAVSEDSAPECASPVPEELIEPAAQAAEESSEEAADAAVSDASYLNAERIVSETTEAAEDELIEQDNIIDPGTEQITAEFVDQAVDQAIEESMELGHTNSESAAEPEETAETSSPISAAEEPTSAPGAPADEPVVVEEPAAVSAAAHPSKPFIKLEAKEGETNASPFSVIVSQVYDGPLDLLLDLIRKQDIDIYDIPIARITAQFLSYVNQLKASDVDVAGEFIYTASLLIHIKSKMLLPRAPSGPDDAAEDPRRELVERLLEHERFKNAAQMLQQKQMLEAATWTNPGVREFKEDTGAEPEIAADTVDLVRVFREILERARNRPILNVEEDSVTVGQMIQFLSRRLSMEDRPIALRKLLSHSRSERALIAMFLALLELVRLQAILLRQDLAFSEIFIKKHSNFESVMTESVAHDDWR